MTHSYYVVQGVSWRGNVTKRDGRSIACGHKHESPSQCRNCLVRLRTERPGNCQDYRIARINMRSFRAGAM